MGRLYYGDIRFATYASMRLTTTMTPKETATIPKNPNTNPIEEPLNHFILRNSIPCTNFPKEVSAEYSTHVSLPRHTKSPLTGAFCYLLATNSYEIN